MFGMLDGQIDFLQQTFLVFAESASQDKLVGCMIASENGRFQFECADKLPDFLEAFMLVHLDELAVVSFLETFLAMRQVQNQCRQKFGLGFVGE